MDQVTVTSLVDPVGETSFRGVLGENRAWIAASTPDQISTRSVASLQRTTGQLLEKHRASMREFFQLRKHAYENALQVANR